MKAKSVYVVGAGLSAGLGFPTIADLLVKIWDRLEAKGLSQDLADVIRFHHPSFNAALTDSFPNIEALLSEMQANSQLFNSSRPATGRFTSEKLDQRQQELLLELSEWFHEIQNSALKKIPSWLKKLVDKIKKEEALVISFNWDLVLDQLLFGENVCPDSYGMGERCEGPQLIKPHGSLNWYLHDTGKHLKGDKTFLLFGDEEAGMYAFKPFRAPISSRRRYMPFIVPPVYSKHFEDEISQHLWRKTVDVLSTASEVTFLGYSLPEADFHARFILRCGFHSQEYGELKSDGNRARPTGRARVVIVDPNEAAARRVASAVGWSCTYHQAKISEWMKGESSALAV